MNKINWIGPHSTAWAEAMLCARGIEGTRVLMGLVALSGIDQAALQRGTEKCLQNSPFQQWVSGRASHPRRFAPLPPETQQWELASRGQWVAEPHRGTSIRWGVLRSESSHNWPGYDPTQPSRGVDHFPCRDVATFLAMNSMPIDARLLWIILFYRIGRFGVAIN